MAKKKARTSKHSSTNTIRIIGGEWRSRKLPFIDAQGLRPTPDRVRETLFNWLQGQTHGANCLDLFAGSGVLGFEALSRGATSTTFIEKNKQVSTQLESNISLLNAQATLLNCDAIDYLQKHSQEGLESFDLIFLDPPYRQSLLEKVLEVICNKENKLINNNSLIYLEHEAEESFNWELFGLDVLKQTHAGQVKSYLMSLKKS